MEFPSHRISHAEMATLRFMLGVAAIVCFALGLAGIRPLGPDSGSASNLGFIFLALAIAILDPENPPDAGVVPIDEPPEALL